MDLTELLEIGIKFHGHKCPAMPLGLKAGLAALKKLNVERASNKELFCLVESGPSHATMCFVDGIQVATGCTYGKGNIKKLNYGKNALRLIELKTKRSVRVSLNPKFQREALGSEFVKLRAKGIEPKDIPPEIVDPLIEKIISTDDSQILQIGPVETITFSPPKGTFNWTICENCKEIVFETGIRLVNGKHYCIPCAKL